MTSKSTTTDWQTLGFFAAASAIAVGLGSYGLSLGGAEFGTWSLNLFAWLTGLVLSVPLILVGRRRGFSPAIVLIAIVALAASLMAPGQSGVHRWLDLGPVSINVAALVLPASLVALSAGLPPTALLAAIAAMGALLVAQPDASQATAFLLAAALILLNRPIAKGLLAFGLLMTGGLAVAAWLRPDPLQPVAEVEGIFGLIADISMPLAAAAGLALALTSLVPLLS